MVKELLDPRPDLQKDSWLWEILLHHVRETKFYWLLHGFRSAGTRLVLKENGRLVMRPHIGPDGWENVGVYMEFRERYLLPVREEVEKILEDVSGILVNLKLVNRKEKEEKQRTSV
ncbi:hypothetical protein V3F56_06320 [Moorellaceae bacterium AZ2]